jgi:sulfur carrier protein ThiS
MIEFDDPLENELVSPLIDLPHPFVVNLNNDIVPCGRVAEKINVARDDEVTLAIAVKIIDDPRVDYSPV